MKQAGDIEERYCFRYNKDVYYVLKHLDTDDGMIVVKIISDGRFVGALNRNEENFNPYTEVEPI